MFTSDRRLLPQETYKLPHRLIEKKRRDRINECIAQLKDMLPEHLKLTVSSRRHRITGIVSVLVGGAPPCGCVVVLHSLCSGRQQPVTDSEQGANGCGETTPELLLVEIDRQ